MTTTGNGSDQDKFKQQQQQHHRHYQPQQQQHHKQGPRTGDCDNSTHRRNEKAECRNSINDDDDDDSSGGSSTSISSTDDYYDDDDENCDYEDDNDDDDDDDDYAYDWEYQSENQIVVADEQQKIDAKANGGTDQPSVGIAAAAASEGSIATSDGDGVNAAAPVTVGTIIGDFDRLAVNGSVRIASANPSNDGRCDHMTSNISSERCFGIRQLLEEQHRKWWSKQHIQQQQLQEWWADRDSYNLTAFKQINGIWPRGHPLPLPDWAPADNEQSKGITFDNVWQYEDLIAIIETKLHRMLEETHYDTAHLFIDFYKAFKRTRRSDLRSFFQFYDIPINRRHHMCVSLAMEIMTRLIAEFPVLEHYMYLVSCEEQLVSVDDYLETIDEAGGLNAEHANVEKEHAMVAMKVSIAGREGVIILDPGYHVGRVITVMNDQSYPHTGWFTQAKEEHIQRDYCYNYNPRIHKYVEWRERETRGDKVSYNVSLVNVDQPYLTAIDVTVRRNLVYNFRSLLARDAKGRVFAGIYLPVLPKCTESHFTIFYDGPNEQRVKAKFMFNTFKNPHKIPENLQQHLENLAPQLNMPLNELHDICKSLTQVVTDQDFITQLLAINDDIGNMSAEI